MKEEEIPWLYVLRVYLVSRVLTALFVYGGHLSQHLIDPGPDAWKGISNWWLNPWTLYDSFWYLSIAREGYTVMSARFFPLYPLLMRLGGSSDPGLAATGVVLSNFFFFVALAVLYALTKKDLGEETARITVWIAAFFPTTAFFSAVYSESLFLLLAALAFYAGRKENWILAGMIGFLASLTRNSGVLLSAALLVEYIYTVRSREARVKPEALLALLLPAAGFAAVALWQGHVLGDPFLVVSGHGLSGREPSFPWTPLWKDAVYLVTREPMKVVAAVPLLTALLVPLLAFIYRKKTRPGYVVFMLGILSLHLVYAPVFPPHNISVPRYMSTTFPFLQLLALPFAGALSSPRIRGAAVALYGTLCFLYSFVFGMKGYLG